VSAEGAILLLGPAAETEPVARDLRALGANARAFDRLEGFAAALLSEPVRGVALWDTAPPDELEVALELVRHHHVRPGRGAVVVRSAGGRDPVPGGDWVEVPAPVTARGLLAQFREEPAAEEADLGKIPRILVVDDDQNMVLLGSHIVSSLGMIPLVAFDGDEALDKVRRFHPDLVLLDINMPRMNGFQVIEALKEDPATRLVPIIVFSARTEPDDKVRALKAGADDYVTKPFSIPELSARIDRLLKRTAAGISASSTTGLPGTVTLEQVLHDRIRSGAPLAVLYADADRFKAFNDRYGFARGDGVIRQIADIILNAVRELGNPDDFVGHIGGDDFVVVTTPDRAVPIAERIVARFDRVIPYYYDPEDRKRGAIETTDRKGRVTWFPIMTLSIAIVTNETRRFAHPGEVADVAAQLKRYAKSRPGSLWVKDQRTDRGTPAA